MTDIIQKNCSQCNKEILKDNNYFYDHSFKNVIVFCNDECLQEYCHDYCNDSDDIHEPFDRNDLD